MLQGLFAVAKALKHGLPFGIEGVESLLDRLFFAAVLELFAAEFVESLSVLSQPFLQLLLFLLKRVDAGLQLLSPFAASLLFVQPGPRSARNIR